MEQLLCMAPSQSPYFIRSCEESRDNKHRLLENDTDDAQLIFGGTCYTG